MAQGSRTDFWDRGREVSLSVDTAKSGDVKAKRYPPIDGQPCCDLPSTIVDQHAFLYKPVNVGAKGNEGPNSRQFAETTDRAGLAVRPDAPYHGVVGMEEPVADSSAAEDNHMKRQTAEFFRSIDACEFDEGALRSSATVPGQGITSEPRRYLESVVADMTTAGTGNGDLVATSLAAATAV